MNGWHSKRTTHNGTLSIPVILEAVGQVLSVFMGVPEDLGHPSSTPHSEAGHKGALWAEMGSAPTWNGAGCSSLVLSFSGCQRQKDPLGGCASVTLSLGCLKSHKSGFYSLAGV